MLQCSIEKNKIVLNFKLVNQSIKLYKSYENAFSSEPAFLSSEREPEQKGETQANDGTNDNGVSTLSEVDLLDKIIDNRKPRKVYNKSKRIYSNRMRSL